MEKKKSELVLGSSLILFGLFVLSINLDLVYIDAQLIVSFIFLASGAYIVRRHIQNPNSLVLILAFILSYIGCAILSDYIPGFNSQFLGTIFLWGVGSLFAVEYIRKKENWGFVIPTGLFFTLGLMVLLDLISYFDGSVLGVTFFIGLGLTFAYLYLIRDEKNKLDWARIPAFVSIIVCGLILITSSDSIIANLYFPTILILLGGYLVVQSQKMELQSRKSNVIKI